VASRGGVQSRAQVTGRASGVSVQAVVRPPAWRTLRVGCAGYMRVRYGLGAPEYAALGLVVLAEQTRFGRLADGLALAD
jgi:hypothetical protein